MIGPHNAPYRLYICCFISKPKLLKFDRLENLSQISHLSPPVKFSAGMGEISEAEFQIQHRTQSVIQFWCGIAAWAGRSDTYSSGKAPNLDRPIIWTTALPSVRQQLAYRHLSHVVAVRPTSSVWRKELLLEKIL